VNVRTVAQFFGKAEVKPAFRNKLQILILFQKLPVFAFPRQLKLATLRLFVIKTTTIVHIVASYCDNTSGIEKIMSILTLSFEFLFHT
jgi:hypothetical protein